MRVRGSPGREGDDPEPQGRGSAPPRVVGPDPVAERTMCARAALASGPEFDSGAPRDGDELDRSPPETVVSPSTPTSASNLDMYVVGALAPHNTVSQKTTSAPEQSVAAAAETAAEHVHHDTLGTVTACEPDLSSGGSSSGCFHQRLVTQTRTPQLHSLQLSMYIMTHLM